MSVQPPPIYAPMVDGSGIVSLPWILFFNQGFNGDGGTDFTPVFTNLASVGTPTITGRYYKIGPLYYITIKIVPATSTTSTAGSTYCNMPIIALLDGVCFAVSGLLGAPVGMIDAASNRIYVPAWSAVTVPLTIIAIVPAR